MAWAPDGAGGTLKPEELPLVGWDWGDDGDGDVDGDGARRTAAAEGLSSGIIPMTRGRDDASAERQGQVEMCPSGVGFGWLAAKLRAWRKMGCETDGWLVGLGHRAGEGVKSPLTATSELLPAPSRTGRGSGGLACK
jgi:hypothetical protein